MSKIEERVAQEILDRAGHGFNKYGKTVERSDLTSFEWVQHAKEEAMDLAVYLERIKQRLSCPLSEDDFALLLSFIDEVKETGYEPDLIYQPMLKKFEHWVLSVKPSYETTNLV
jgi:hypothetical protein